MNTRFLLALPVLGLAAVVLAGAAFYTSVPLVPPDLDARYTRAALSNVPPAPHLAMEAIDAVRFHQDWSKVNDDTLYGLASMFGSCWDDDYDNKHVHRCVRHSMDDVATNLGFTADDKQLAQVYLNTLTDIKA